MLADDGKMYSQYPPGHLFTLALGVMLQAPWLCCIVLSALCLPLMYTFTARIYDQRTAILAMFMLALSPFFLFMSASYMNHITELFFFLLVFVSYQKWESNRGTRVCLITLGVSGGMLFLSRPLTGVTAG